MEELLPTFLLNTSTVTHDLLMGVVLQDIPGTGKEGALGGLNSWDNANKYKQHFWTPVGV